MSSETGTPRADRGRREADRDGDDPEVDGGGDGYVHVPEGGRPPGQASADADRTEAGLGGRGWVLVGVVVLATLVLPGVVYLYPQFLAEYLPFRFAMLAVPFAPALLLGAAAIWAMAARRG